MGIIRYELMCPQCGYHYWMELLKPATHEMCPVCASFRVIEEFIMEVKNVLPIQTTET